MMYCIGEGLRKSLRCRRHTVCKRKEADYWWETKEYQRGKEGGQVAERKVVRH